MKAFEALADRVEARLRGASLEEAALAAFEETPAHTLGSIDEIVECYGGALEYVHLGGHGEGGTMAFDLMLLQADGDAIHLLPAWPTDWDVDAKLHAPGRTIVRVRVVEGELVSLDVEPPERLADVYFCNVSIFQSLPDSWAIDQLFPICPIHRLEEPPTRRGVVGTSIGGGGSTPRSRSTLTWNSTSRLPCQRFQPSSPPWA